MKEKIYIGVSYYPEQWPRERWQTDLAMMQEAGIQVLRVAELAWSSMEPKDGVFCFDWLHDFIHQAQAYGMEIVIGTPTETSPRWLLKKHPEIVARDAAGHIHGQRGGHCYSSQAFQKYSLRLVEAMAREFAGESVVIGWQIDNELKGIKCTCGECNRNFRRWLQDRYGTLEKMNEDCGLIFWSQDYGDWEEVELPADSQLTVPVSMYLEQSRFASYLTTEHCGRQAQVVRQIAPHQFVTHNTLGLYPWLNVYDLAKKLDFISWDTYPAVDGDNYDVCMCHDLHRGIRRDSYWIMEQKNGYLNYAPYNLAIEPGLVRFWAYQDIARGADGVLFYRWRSGRFSVEQNPNGILRHDGTKRRAYEEIRQMTRELEPFLERLRRTRVEAKAAILYSFDELWANESHRQYPGLDYTEFVLSYYKAMARLGITADLVEPGTPLDGYALVVAPCLMMLSEKLAGELQEYAQGGGCLVLTLRSGMKNWSNVTTQETWPGALAGPAGIRVEEFEVFPKGTGNSIRYRDKVYRMAYWTDILTLDTATSMAVWEEKFYRGLPAVSKNLYGKGVVYYVGVMGNEEFLTDFLEDVAASLSLEPRRLPEGVFVTRRRNREECFAFYLNANHHPVELELQQGGKDCFSGQWTEGRITLEGLSVCMLLERHG